MVNVLRIDTAVVDGQPAAMVWIDEVDILQLQRPAHRTYGWQDRPAPDPFRPPDPIALLPPDCAGLLPMTAPRAAMVGICSCGEPGCSSLWIQVRRDADRVVWEPDPNSPRSTIDTTWSFELLQYLDAVDEGAQSVQRWEQRPHRLARQFRQRRDSLFEFSVGSTTEGILWLTDAAASGQPDQIQVTLARRTYHHISVTADLTDEDIITSLNRTAHTDTPQDPGVS